MIYIKNLSTLIKYSNNLIKFNKTYLPCYYKLRKINSISFLLKNYYNNNNSDWWDYISYNSFDNYDKYNSYGYKKVNMKSMKYLNDNNNDNNYNNNYYNYYNYYNKNEDLIIDLDIITWTPNSQSSLNDDINKYCIIIPLLGNITQELYLNYNNNNNNNNDNNNDNNDDNNDNNNDNDNDNNSKLINNSIYNTIKEGNTLYIDNSKHILINNTNNSVVTLHVYIK